MDSRHSKSAQELLLGTWRSDRQRTEAQWVWPKRIADQRRTEFFALFGHLVHRFTRKRCYTTYGQEPTKVVPYHVVWEGCNVFPQLVVVFGTGKHERAKHIFFDSEESYYVQGGKCAEFFRRER